MLYIYPNGVQIYVDILWLQLIEALQIKKRIGSWSSILRATAPSPWLPDSTMSLCLPGPHFAWTSENQLGPGSGVCTQSPGIFSKSLHSRPIIFQEPAASIHSWDSLNPRSLRLSIKIPPWCHPISLAVLMAHYSPLLGCTLDTAAAALRISEEASISKDSDPTYTLETCYIYICML